MASSTKRALADALKQMMEVKPIAKITVKDLVEICNVKEVLYERWQEDVMVFFQYLYDNSSFALNIYNSGSRLYMLRFLKGRLESCIRSFADIVSEGMNIDKQDYDFVIEFYSNGIIGLISQWMDMNMQTPKVITQERLKKMLGGSVENMLSRFQNSAN